MFKSLVLLSKNGKKSVVAKIRLIFIKMLLALWQRRH